MTGLREIVLPAGTVRARVSGGVLDARGVRYGSTGPRRGMPVEPPREAQRAPAAFPQVPGLLDALLGPALGELEQSEDAFTVRIQAPAEACAEGVRLPVLFFVHGGGFTTGSGEARWYDAAALVREGRFVLVTVNHRLGALATVAAEDDRSLAFDDLVVAARWVRSHIDAFGGDPTQVTVAGDSAGAWWAQALSTAPETRGLFRRTLLVSMPRMAPLNGEDAQARRIGVAQHLAHAGHTSTGEAPLDALLDAQRATAGEYRGAGFPFAPAASSRLLPALGEPAMSAAAMHTDEVLCVTTADEASAFLWQRDPATFTRTGVEEFAATHFVDPASALQQLTTGEDHFADAVALQSHWQFHSVAHECAAAGVLPVTWVHVDLPSPLPRVGAPHCFVLPFLFGDREAWADAPMLHGVPDPVFRRTRDAIQGIVLAFVLGAESVAPRFTTERPVRSSIGPAGVRVAQVDGGAATWGSPTGEGEG